MSTSLRTRLRGSRAGSPATPVEYLLLSLAAAMLVALVFFALGQLVDDQLSCQAESTSTAAATAHC
ncbi:MAG TPA: hypothetical protein VMZ00_15940 [Sporichthya sp.]|nr:hypothetical protein [Sporichthya sp.]